MVGQHWGSGEVATLEQHYHDTVKEQLSFMLPNRTWGAIQQKARSCELRRRSGRYFAVLNGVPPWNKGKTGLTYGKIINFPDLSSSSELAYIIGVMFGDGHLRHCRCHYDVELTATDEDFVKEFHRCIAHIMRREVSYPIWKRVNKQGSQIFTTRTTSKLLFFFLKDYARIKPIIEAFPADFIRGFADSEGYVSFINKRNLVVVGMVNTKFWYLSLIQKLLWKSFGIRSRIRVSYKAVTVNRQNCFTLTIKKQEDVEKYAKSIRFSIQRKQGRINEFLANLNVKCKHERVERVRAYFGYRLRCVDCRRYVKGENN